MPDKTTSRHWQVAFAKQAGADFAAWQQLQSSNETAFCSSLHCLQMTCEKLAKAHLCAAGSNPFDIQSSHAYIAKNLPIIARQQFAILSGNQPGRYDERLKQIKLLSREIELLHPDVDDGGQRPDNCEYPWQYISGLVQAPAEHSFPNLNLLHAPVGRTLLKVIRMAIQRLLETQ